MLGDVLSDHLGLSSSPGPATRVLETPELLGYILRHLDHQYLSIACQVSHGWSAIIGAHTVFGALVLYKPRSLDPVSLFMRDLHRGGSRRVLIRIPSMIQDLELIFSKIGINKERVKGIALDHIPESKVPLICQLLRYTMPNMVELILTGEGYQSSSIPDQFTIPELMEAAPRLRRLVCAGIPIEYGVEVKKLHILEFSSGRNVDWGHTALAFWSAPWRDDIAVVGLAFRESVVAYSLESWIATAWCGHIKAVGLKEALLAGCSMNTSLGDDCRTSYRHISMVDTLHGAAFSTLLNDLVVLSMSLHFWGLARAGNEGICFPNLRMLHLFITNLHDDENTARTGPISCPRLTNVALQANDMFNYDDADNESSLNKRLICTFTCTYQQLEQIMDRTVSAKGDITVDLLSVQFKLSGNASRNDLRFRTLHGHHTFESWVHEVYDG